MGMKRFFFRYIRTTDRNVLESRTKKKNVEQNISMTDKKESTSEIAKQFFVLFFLTFSAILVSF